MADLQEFLLNSAVEKMAQQKADLREIRTRISYILTAAGVINGAFIATSNHQARYIELTATALFALGTVLVAANFRAIGDWTFTPNLSILLEDVIQFPEERMRDHILKNVQTWWDTNNKGLDRMSRMINLGLIAFGLSLIAWMFTL